MRELEAKLKQRNISLPLEWTDKLPEVVTVPDILEVLKEIVDIPNALEEEIITLTVDYPDDSDRHGDLLPGWVPIEDPIEFRNSLQVAEGVPLVHPTSRL